MKDGYCQVSYSDLQAIFAHCFAELYGFDLYQTLEVEFTLSYLCYPQGEGYSCNILKSHPLFLERSRLPKGAEAHPNASIIILGIATHSFTHMFIYLHCWCLWTGSLPCFKISKAVIICDMSFPAEQECMSQLMTNSAIFCRKVVCCLKLS